MSLYHEKNKNAGGYENMSTKANYKLDEIGAGKVGFSKTRSIIEVTAPSLNNNTFASSSNPTSSARNTGISVMIVPGEFLANMNRLIFLQAVRKI